MRWRRSRRARLTANRRRAGLAAAALAAALVVACAEVAPRPPAAPVAAPERPYLLAPTAGYGGRLDPELSRSLDALHRRLLVEGAAPELRQSAELLARQRPDAEPAQVLLAQLELAGGDPDATSRRLRSIVGARPGYTAARLLYGRASELLGELPAAFAAYLGIAAEVELAAARVEELRPRAVEIVSNRLGDSLTAGDLEGAAGHLARLESWAPEATATLEGTMRLAAARGDAVAELGAVRELRRRRPDDPALRDRLATLEVAAGDPGAGINILQEIAAERPGDPEIARRLARARFRWRLVLLPEEVGQATRAPELSRGELAALLYWLFPSVRYARPQTARIANDVFDHAFREEIVRVINLDLMSVDPGLHEFAPHEPASRADALGAILRVVAASRPDDACHAALASRQRSSWPIICATAAACGLLVSEADCLPAAALSGGEAVELCRRGQQLIGGE